MTHEISNQLIALCNTVPEKLLAFTEDEFSHKPSPEKWSKKELLGHLIDSAANNHQRFVRSQFETPVVFYEQDLWVSLQRYQSEETETIVRLWEAYNRHLAHVIKQIPGEKLKSSTIGRDGQAYTLQFIIEDYLNHLNYHLKQIL